MAANSRLPVDVCLPELLATLARTPNAVLQAPPGAGKTTRVPLALRQAEWVGERKILMLEPRRLAARAAARFMAAGLGEAVGETIGYRVKLDARVGPATRIEVVTEGVLTRLLQADPALESVAAVIFDEFHERNLQSDLGLALCLDSQSALRPDLRLLVMSATLDGAAVSRLLQEAPVITSAGRAYPVAIHYRPLRAQFTLNRRGFCVEVARSVLEILREESGNVLVFLPGVGEIQQVEKLLSADLPADGTQLAPLHGQLPATAQDRAIQAPAPGVRKIVLATSIAETSLTIEGVRIVVDCGLMRVPRFDPVSGFDRLETLPVTQAAAEQRCGRASRQQAGVCYRLWPQHQHLVAQGAAEIRQADLAPLVMELAQWGVVDANQLCWLDPPPPAHLAQATELLARLGALQPSGMLTAHGRSMLELAAHPRLAHMMLRAREQDLGALACDLAALLTEADPLRGMAGADADLVTRIESLRGPSTGDERLHRRLSHIRREAQRWRQRLHCVPAPPDNRDLAQAGAMLAYAYPDRIARRRAGPGHRFLLSNGRGARFAEAEPLAAADYLVAARLDGAGEARIFLAAATPVEALLHYHADLLAEHCFVNWDDDGLCVQARRQLRLGELVIADEAWQGADTEAVRAAMLEGVRRHVPACLPWNPAARQLQARVNFVHRTVAGQWPDLSDTALVTTLDEWLAPSLEGITRLSQLKRLDLHALLLGRLSWPQRRQLDDLAPATLTVPSGSKISLDYSHDVPVLAVRLQEMFGLADTPKVAGGRIPVLLHLLSPARRPVQITRDLGAFWRGSYHEVKKELKGRYPKHDWPDEPLLAQPTARSRRRS